MFSNNLFKRIIPVSRGRVMERTKIVFGHLQTLRIQDVSKSGTRRVTFDNVRHGAVEFPRAPEDIVVVCAVRTPIGKAKRGSFKDTYPDDLLSAAFNGVLKQTEIDPKIIGDICVGNVGDSRISLSAKAAQFYSGIPYTVPVSSVNRQCASGLQAFMNVVGSIRSGVCDVGLAGGLECMSKGRVEDGSEAINPRLFEVKLARDCIMPMGITSENVASRFGITREMQDQFGLESQLKAALAQKEGKFNAEIIPVTTTILDQNGDEKSITVFKDEGIRPGTTMAGLSKLKPAFKPDGTTTAGNSSQVSDGAAAVLVATRAAAESKRLPVLGVLRSYAVIGCPPDIMGIGPALAIPQALKKAGLTIDDIEVFEINEAFASQCYYCIRELGIPASKVNPNGGAIALGHPLGCTGTRMIATLLHELKRRGKRSYGVVSMCMGTGMGAAAVFEYPGA